MRNPMLRPGTAPSRWMRDESAQSAVEFALVVPMVVILIIGMVEFARVYTQYQVVTDAAREAARMAVIADDDLTEAQKDSAIVAHIETAVATAGINETTEFFKGCQTVSTSTAVSVEIYECDWHSGRGVPAVVTLRSPYEFSFLDAFLPGTPTISLTTSFTMRNE